MQLKPTSATELVITPTSEVEAFYVQGFLEAWKRGDAKLILRTGVFGLEPHDTLELLPAKPSQGIPFTFKLPPTT